MKKLALAFLASFGIGNVFGMENFQMARADITNTICKKIDEEKRDNTAQFLNKKKDNEFYGYIVSQMKKANSQEGKDIWNGFKNRLEENFYQGIKFVEEKEEFTENQERWEYKPFIKKIEEKNTEKEEKFQPVVYLEKKTAKELKKRDQGVKQTDMFEVEKTITNSSDQQKGADTGTLIFNQNFKKDCKNIDFNEMTQFQKKILSAIVAQNDQKGRAESQLAPDIDNSLTLDRQGGLLKFKGIDYYNYQMQCGGQKGQRGSFAAVGLSQEQYDMCVNIQQKLNNKENLTEEEKNLFKVILKTIASSVEKQLFYIVKKA
jgi:hypothetical protein